MNAQKVKTAFAAIADTMKENRGYLISLDQQNGDGDLGISMEEGFLGVREYLEGTEETDLGKLFMGIASAFNAKAPSSLGTILSIGFMGMAKSLKGKQEADVEETADAILAGIDKIMLKAKSNLGEKTILDALHPGASALKEHASEGAAAYRAAAKAAAEGSEATRNMLSKHGRAAYYGEKSLGVLDGGSVVGRLIFESLADKN